MNKRLTTQESSARAFIAVSEERVELWRELHRAVKDKRQPDVAAQLARLDPLEELCGYPGPRLMAQVHERLKPSDWTGFARLVQRISRRCSRTATATTRRPGRPTRRARPACPTSCRPSIGRGQSRRPYFEVLFVSPAERAMWPGIRETFRRLRRAEDEFVYEPVVVGSFEDAVLAVRLQLQPPGGRDQSTASGTRRSTRCPTLREFLAPPGAGRRAGARRGDSARSLARAGHAASGRSSTSTCSTDRDVEKLAGADEAAPIRRVFYGVEEPMELHLAILDGVKDRYETPYFDNLKKYAQRPIGTFHALPIARGKSIFKSNWIRDMGEFYGTNLFLAESSATTGGLDSLLEPTGNIKEAQDKAARAFGGDRAFFVTNGTSTSNKIVVQALLQAGRHRHRRPQLPQVAPLRLRAGGRAAALRRSLPADAVLDVRRGAAAHRSRRRCSSCKAEGKLDRVEGGRPDQLHLRRPHVQPARVMEECLAIKPDLIFLWDEAWFGFARFSPFLRRRTGDGRGRGARATLMRDPAYREALRGVQGRAPASSTRRTRRCSTAPAARPGQGAHPRLPDQLDAQVDVGAPPGLDDAGARTRTSTTVEAPFKEAFFTHTSTSPNLQIIASLDVARRQMELEGYELTMRDDRAGAASCAAQINSHPLISKYFQVATPAEMIPAEFRESGIKDYGTPACDAGPTCSSALGRRRVRARSDAHDAGLRRRRLRRHAVQGPAGRAVRHPDQQDLAQQRAGPDQHQQHAQRRRAADQGAGRHVARDRRAPAPRAATAAQAAFDGAREVADDGRAGPAELQPLPRRVPRQPEEQHATKATCAPAFFMAYDEANCEYVKLAQPGDRRAAEERARSWSRPTS